MPDQELRGAQLTAVIEPKLLFLAKLAAREKGQTLVEFIENAFTRALSPDAMLEEEPTYGTAFNTESPMPLWMEGLWIDTGKRHEDEVARLFMVGVTNVALLAPKQRSLFHHIFTEVGKQGKMVTLKAFVEFIDYSGVR